MRGLRGEAIGYYAIATDRATGQVLAAHYRSREEMEEHRDRFASTKTKDGVIYGPWVDHFDAMGEKTQIRTVLNDLPLPAELIHAWQAEQMPVGSVDIGPITQAPVDTTPEQLARGNGDAPLDTTATDTGEEQ